MQYLLDESFFDSVHIGEMAHVIAKKDKGPRGLDAHLKDRNAYENLILLCANHHTEVDQNSLLYTAEKLHYIKSEHEASVRCRLSKKNNNISDIEFLRAYMNFAPFTSIHSFIEHLPNSFHIKITEIGDMFDAILIDLPHCYPFEDKNLNLVFNEFMSCYKVLWNIISDVYIEDGETYQIFDNTVDRHGRVFLNKENMSYPTRNSIESSLLSAKTTLLNKYNKLIAYLRNNYKELNINTYHGSFK